MHEIKLTETDPVRSKSIFKTDSISLLIGENGSGKTYALSKIIESFAAKTKSGEPDCLFSIDYNETVLYPAMPKKYGAIYYTPVINHPKLPRSRRFVDVSPKGRSNLDPTTLLGHEYLIESFGIIPKIIAKFEVNPYKVISAVVDVFIEQGAGKCNVPDDIKYLISRLTDISDQRKNIEKNSSDLFLESKSNIDNPEDAQKAIYNEIVERLLQYLSSINGDYHLFSALLSANVAALQKKAGRYVITAILSRLLEKELINNNRGYKSNWVEESLDIYYHVLHTTQSQPFFSKKTRSWRIDIPLHNRDHTAIPRNIATIEWEGLSSGEWALATQLCRIEQGISTLSKRGHTNILLLIDEGDTFLHLDWQRKYLGALDSILFQMKKKYGIDTIQTIVATHSPLLATDIPREFVTSLSTQNRSPVSFAAPLQLLLNEAFSAGTIGEIAIETIKSCIEKLRSGIYGEYEKYVISIVDDPVLRNHLNNLADNAILRQ